MLGFGNKDIPEKVVKAGLKKWYNALAEPDKVKLKRYLDKADASSASSFVLSVFSQAIEDANYRFVGSMYDTVRDIKMSDCERFDINDAAVLGAFNSEDYKRCLQLCDIGLELLKKKEVFDHVMAKGVNGAIPDEINCRNHKLNIIVGVYFDYDEGDRLLLQFQDMGLITAEDVEYRRNGIKTFRLQRTFDNVFNIKEKDQ
ncbi:MAG: hypothetical protein MJZ21_01495 [archaeon]|nr:hypothetical protein [archaeon]